MGSSQQGEGVPRSHWVPGWAETSPEGSCGQGLLGLGPVLISHPFTHTFMRFLAHRLPFFSFNIYLLFMCWLLRVLVVAHGIFNCSIQTLSCGMWDLVP